MKPDEHLRAALRHAPDADQQAPPDVSAQILAAAHRAAAEPVPRPSAPTPRTSRWAPWWRGHPLRLGASGALASVALAGVLTLVWQGGAPGPAAEHAQGDSAPAVATAPTAAPTPPAAAVLPASVAPPSAQRPALSRVHPPAPATPLPPKAAGGSADAMRTLHQADSAALAAPRPALIQAPAAPPPSTTAAAAPAPAPVAPPLPPAESAVAGAPATASPERRGAMPPPAPAAAAAPAPLFARALSAAPSQAPWAALLAASTGATWLIDGLAVPLDADWLRALDRLTVAGWTPAASVAPEPDALQLQWLQGGVPAALLWLGRTQAGWCAPPAACQTAQLPEAAADALKDALKKKLPR